MLDDENTDNPSKSVVQPMLTIAEKCLELNVRSETLRRWRRDPKPGVKYPRYIQYGDVIRYFPESPDGEGAGT